MHQTQPQLPDVPHRILKRAQYEAFAFAWVDGDIRVRNESHAEPSAHEYLVRIVNGRPVACTCPADDRFDHPCKHRVALSLRRPILAFVAAANHRARSSLSLLPLEFGYS